MAWSNKRIVLAVLLLLLLLTGGLLVGFWLARDRLSAALGLSPGGGLIAHEPFDYGAGIALAGQQGGHGFGGAWEPGGFNTRNSEVFQMKPGPLTYSNLAVSGSDHLSIDLPIDGGSAICGVGRHLGRDLAVPGTTCYLSFLYRPDAEGGYGSVVVGTGEGRELSIGRSTSGAPFHISQRGGTGRVFSRHDAVVGETFFIVVKMEFTEGPDRFTLFINPAPGQPEPAGEAIKEDLDLTSATHLFLYSRSAWSVDELRLGRTWASVTPRR